MKTASLPSKSELLPSVLKSWTIYLRYSFLTDKVFLVFIFCSFETEWRVNTLFSWHANLNQADAVKVKIEWIQYKKVNSFRLWVVHKEKCKFSKLSEIFRGREREKRNSRWKQSLHVTLKVIIFFLDSTCKDVIQIFPSLSKKKKIQMNLLTKQKQTLTDLDKELCQGGDS